MKKITKKQKTRGQSFLVCESAFAGCLEQTKHALDVFFFEESRLEKNVVMIGVYGVARTEALAVVELLKDVSCSIISPKHRLAKEITETYLKALEDIKVSVVQNISDPEYTRCAKVIVRYLSTLHIVLHEDSTPKKRTDAYLTFQEEFIDFTSEKYQGTL